VQRRKLIVQSVVEGCIAGEKPTDHAFLVAARPQLHAPASKKTPSRPAKRSRKLSGPHGDHLFIYSPKPPLKAGLLRTWWRLS